MTKILVIGGAFSPPQTNERSYRCNQLKAAIPFGTTQRSLANDTVPLMATAPVLCGFPGYLVRDKSALGMVSRKNSIVPDVTRMSRTATMCGVTCVRV